MSKLKTADRVLRFLYKNSDYYAISIANRVYICYNAMHKDLKCRKMTFVINDFRRGKNYEKHVEF